MSAQSQSIASPRLQRLAQRRSEPPEPDPERCELCAETLPASHRHLLTLETRQLVCVCRACALLFDRREAGGGHYRLVPERRLRLQDFELSDLAWEQLRIPVDMAFFFRDTAAGRVVAFYPGAMGATESRLELEAWEEIGTANPVLDEMEPDVEALLVDRTRDARRQWLVPIDDCFALVGLIRTRWRGFSGGKEVWQELDRFFERLDQRARPSAQRRQPENLERS